MTDNNMKLSQEEIDALFSRPDSEGHSRAEEQAYQLTPEQKDALGEIGNISFGSAATSLSTLLQQRVDITTPNVNVIHSSTVKDWFPKPYVLVSVEFTAGLGGSNALAIEVDDAKTIADLMLGGDGTNTQGSLNELHLSAVAEAMNQMMGGAATSMSQIFGMPVNISPPKVDTVDLSAPDAFLEGLDGWIVNVEFNLKVGTLIDSKIMQLLPAKFAQDLLLKLGIGQESAVTAVMEPPTLESNPVQSNASMQGLAKPSFHEQTLDEENMREKPSYTQAATMANVEPIHRSVSGHEEYSSASVSPATHQSISRPEFLDFGANQGKMQMPPRNLALLFDVPLNVTVELGRAKKVIRDVLDLAPGSILELDKLAGEPVDILVNNKKIAIGEVVVIDENFGVRVTDIISPSDRVKHLQ